MSACATSWNYVHNRATSLDYIRIFSFTDIQITVQSTVTIYLHQNNLCSQSPLINDVCHFDMNTHECIVYALRLYGSTALQNAVKADVRHVEQYHAHINFTKTTSVPNANTIHNSIGLNHKDCAADDGIAVRRYFHYFFIWFNRASCLCWWC